MKLEGSEILVPSFSLCFYNTVLFKLSQMNFQLLRNKFTGGTSHLKMKTHYGRGWKPGDSVLVGWGLE